MKVYQSRCATLLHHSEHEIWYGGTVVRLAEKVLKTILELLSWCSTEGQLWQISLPLLMGVRTP